MKLSKVLSLVLAIAMLLTMPSFAASYTDVAADANYAEAVTVLSALNILTGYEDGSFKPDGKITRAEYSAIVCRVNNMGDSAKANQVGGIFTDVAADHWASGYIATAYQAGIVNGMGDGTFAPEAEVTYEQAVKMLVAALGYEMKAQSMGGYPTGYMMIANQESITVGTSNSAGGASRATVAKLTYNALTVPMMDQTAWGSETKFEPILSQSLLYTKLNAVKADVKLTSVPLNKTVTDVQLTYKKFDAVTEYNRTYYNLTVDTNVKINGNDLTGLQGLTATAIIDISDDSETKLVCVVPKTGKNVEVVIDPTMLFSKDNGSGYVEYYKTNDDDKETKLKLDATEIASATYVNLVKGNYTKMDNGSDIGDVKAGGNLGDVAYRYVDTDNDGDFDTVFVEKEEVFVVGSVNTTSNKIFRETSNSNAMTTMKAASITLDPDDDTTAWKITDAEGNAMELADIEAGDIAAVKKSVDGTDNYYEIVISNETAEGVIAETYSEKTKVGGTTVTKYKIGDTGYTMLDKNAVATFKPGDNIVAQIYDGKIVCYTVAAGVRNYGVVIATNVAQDFGETYQVQLLTQKGEIVTFNLNEKFNAAANKWTFTQSALDTAFPKGALVAYELNSSEEIKYVDVQGGYSGNVLDSTLKFASNSGDQYKLTSEKLGSMYITDETVVVATETAANAITKSNIYMSSKDILEEDTNYTWAAVANDSKEAQFIVLFQAANAINMNSFPIVVTKTASVTVDGDSRIKYVGFVNGEEVEITVAEETSGAAASLAINDVAMYTVNGAGEMTNAAVLAKYATTGYTVIDNSANAKDDEKVAKAGIEVGIGFTASSSQITKPLGTATPSLKGFGAAGKAYTVQGKTLRLIDDYAATFADVDATPLPTPSAGAVVARNYDKKVGGSVVDEGLIKDYAINSSAIAYIYNKRTDKVKVTTIADLETDVNSADRDNWQQIDNDDAVYVYNFDGETKLILIIDANGDN